MLRPSIGNIAGPDSEHVEFVFTLHRSLPKRNEPASIHGHHAGDGRVAFVDEQNLRSEGIKGDEMSSLRSHPDGFGARGQSCDVRLAVRDAGDVQ